MYSAADRHAANLCKLPPRRYRGRDGTPLGCIGNHYGRDSVFLDVEAIPVGKPFPDEIEKAVARCGVLLAVIGRNWIDQKDDAGDRRLENSSDFVRLEIASALRRDIPVVPVLVHGARMPRRDQLPDDLKALAYRNGVELTHARWRSDVDLLIQALDSYVRPPPGPTPPPHPEPPPKLDSAWPARLAVIVVVLVAAVLGVLAYGGHNDHRLAYNMVPAPELHWLPVSDAKAKLLASGLSVGTIIRVPDAKAVPNIVLGAQYEAGTLVKVGTAIDLHISEPVTLPDSSSSVLNSPADTSISTNKVATKVALFPYYAGTWTASEMTENGSTKPSAAGQITITQEGPTVLIKSHDTAIDGSVIQIDPDGTFSHRTYGEWNVKSGPLGVPADQADFVVTETYRLSDESLLEEASFETIRYTEGHPIGKKVTAIRYHR